MECSACTQACPAGAIVLEESEICTRLLEGRSPLSIDEERCTDCGECRKICPMGDPALSARSCSFCLVCSGRSRCIVYGGDRASFGNAAASVARLFMLLPRFLSS
jgi:ferredoxin